MKLLADGEVGGVSIPEMTSRLANGDEYLDLEQLERGVQRAKSGAVTPVGQILPRKAIHEDTWRRILRQLPATPV